MEFPEDQITNAAFGDTPLAWDAPYPEGDQHIHTGAQVDANGDIRFSLRLPHAEHVQIVPQRGEIVELAREGELFTGELPFDAGYTGPRAVDVLIDGDLVLYPNLPIYWSGNRPSNFVEVPEIDSDYLLVKHVPHGSVGREIYWSSALQHWRRAIVYTPPGYMRGTARLPVLYLLHGFSDNELSWIYQGKLPYILDNLIASGAIDPFIVVMNNGMARHQRQSPDVIDDAFQRMLVEDCIPFIESSYRVETGKWNRALAGLSMGAYMTSDIGLAYPDLFGYLGTFTASMTHETIQMSYQRPFATVLAPGAATDAYRVFFRSTTPAEDHFDYFEADDRICELSGITTQPGYRRVVYPPTTSKWNSWRLGLRDFSQLIFNTPSRDKYAKGGTA